MIYKKINLKKEKNYNVGKDSTLEIYLCEETSEIVYQNRPAMLVIPGGAYEFCSAREGEPVALRFMSEGFNCFVLKYTCKTPYPVPQLEVAAAINYINKHSKEFNIEQNKISLIGFSAGGHLAATYGYLYKELSKQLKCDEKSLKPLSIILGYPVITMGKETHSLTSQNITNNFDKKLINLLSAEKHVTKDYPPTFVWTTKTDELVPYQNSKIFVEALKKNKVEHRFHLFKEGPHGGSLSTRGVYDFRFKISKFTSNSIWVNEASKFIYKLFKK